MKLFILCGFMVNINFQVFVIFCKGLAAENNVVFDILNCFMFCCFKTMTLLDCNLWISFVCCCRKFRFYWNQDVHQKSNKYFNGEIECGMLLFIKLLTFYYGNSLELKLGTRALKAWMNYPNYSYKLLGYYTQTAYFVVIISKIFRENST